MKKITSLIPLLFLGISFNAQVGIGTNNPRGAVDINTSAGTNNMGLVLPTNSATGNIVNPIGGNVAIGTLMYDSTDDCVKAYKSTGWSDCLTEGACTGTTTVLGSTPIVAEAWVETTTTVDKILDLKRTSDGNFLACGYNGVIKFDEDLNVIWKKEKTGTEPYVGVHELPNYYAILIGNDNNTEIDFISKTASTYSVQKHYDTSGYGFSNTNTTSSMSMINHNNNLVVLFQNYNTSPHEMFYREYSGTTGNVIATSNVYTGAISFVNCESISESADASHYYSVARLASNNTKGGVIAVSTNLNGATPYDATIEVPQIKYPHGTQSFTFLNDYSSTPGHLLFFKPNGEDRRKIVQYNDDYTAILNSTRKIGFDNGNSNGGDFCQLSDGSFVAVLGNIDERGITIQTFDNTYTYQTGDIFADGYVFSYPLVAVTSDEKYAIVAVRAEGRSNDFQDGPMDVWGVAPSNPTGFPMNEDVLLMKIQLK